jgi:hypothetical protein
MGQKGPHLHIVWANLISRTNLVLAELSRPRYLVPRTKEAPMAKRASDIVQVRVRMRADMHRALQRAAEKRGQTLNAEILNRLADDQERDRELVKETIVSTLAQLDDESLAQHTAKRKAAWERGWAEAGVVNLLDKLRDKWLREEAKEQLSAATNEERKADIVTLIDWLREQAEERTSAATNEETKNRTGTGDKS